MAAKHFNYKYLQILKWGFQSNEDTNFTYYLAPDNINYMVSLIAVVLKKDFQTVAGYIEEIQNDRELQQHIITETQKSPLSRFADKEVRFARRMGWYVFARVTKPKLIIETGVDKGLGAVMLCAALLKNKAEGFEGRYIGTDINPAAGYLLSGVYSQVGVIHYGDSIESLKKIQTPIDLFINDSDHSISYEYEEYITIQNKLAPKSIILGDNSAISDSLFRFSRESNRQFVYFQEKPLNHWYPGDGIGISFVPEG